MRPSGTTPSAVIGIDLGTTNCALAWAELPEDGLVDATPSVQRLEIPQVLAESEVGALDTLASCLYLVSPDERRLGVFDLPWAQTPERVAGVWARDHGALRPGQLVLSAKSWLCHPDVDRRARILPWDADPAERVCSPVEASTALLAHLRDAWNYLVAREHADRQLERQAIVLAVPASFDEEARELTIEAARATGFVNLVLQEEPTAALYAWLAANRGRAASHLRAGDRVLVCDVGGGTTDFTLVAVKSAGDELAFERVAVGDHLLLGGDNLDLALARLAETRLQEEALTFRQRQALRRQCAAAKEQLLAPGPDEVSVTVLGSGRSVIGGARTVVLRRQEVERLLLDGFLPLVEAHARPLRQSRHGLRELGLPFEEDPAVTRHLAQFLGEAGDEDGPARPDVVLFNGGFFVPQVARDRVVEVLRRWFAPEDPGWSPRVLTNASPSTAVAEGAACYGLVRRGFGTRIGGGSPRAYYLGLHGEMSVPAADSINAVCVLPRGAEEGMRAFVGEQFEVVANQQRAFSLWSSRTRQDGLGAIVTLDRDATHAHAPLAAELRFGKRSRSVALKVRLDVEYTALGTIELWLSARDTDHRWRLQFEIRGGARSSAGVGALADAQLAVHADALAGAISLVDRVFGGSARDPGALSPEELPAALEASLGLGRLAWPVLAIRPLADRLLDNADGRAASGRHEARWLNLVGFCLRPGFGATRDEWRMGQLRRTYLAGLAFPRDVQGQAEWLVLWQRVAGGMTSGQQQEAYQRHAPSLFASLAKKGKRLPPQVERESWRLLASLERLSASTRAALGEEIVGQLARYGESATLWWALGRVGARVPTHGPLNTVVAPAVVAGWVERLLKDGPPPGPAGAALVDLAALTGDPARDVDERTRLHLADVLGRAGVTRGSLSPLLEVRRATRDDLQRQFGEALPEGLALASEG